MADLSLLADLSTFPVTRQDLFDMWTTADLAAIATGDLADEIAVINTGTDFSDAPMGSDLRPGALFYNQADNLMFCFFDQIDATGVSLWLAIGPDRFDVPCLAAEHIPAGAPVEVVYDKWCGLPTEATQMPMGFNQSGITNVITMNDPVQRVNSSGSTVTEFGGETTPSGSWFRCAIEGIVYGQQTNPDAAATATNQDIQNSQPVQMDPNDPISLISQGSWAGTAYNAVGIALVSTNGNNLATEAPNTLRFQFDPRMLIGFL